MSTIIEKQSPLNRLNYDHGSRIARVEVIIENINETLIRMEKNFDRIDKRLDILDNDIKSNFKWTLSTMIGFALVLCGIMAKGFHWY